MQTPPPPMDTSAQSLRCSRVPTQQSKSPRAPSPPPGCASLLPLSSQPSYPLDSAPRPHLRSPNRHQQHRSTPLPRPLSQRHHPRRRRNPRRRSRRPPHPTQRAPRNRRRPIRRLRRRRNHPPPPPPPPLAFAPNPPPQPPIPKPPPAAACPLTAPSTPNQPPPHHPHSQPTTPTTTPRRAGPDSRWAATATMSPEAPRTAPGTPPWARASVLQSSTAASTRLIQT